MIVLKILSTSFVGITHCRHIISLLHGFVAMSYRLCDADPYSVHRRPDTW